MFKRFTMIAVLGFILSVVFAGTAQAEQCSPDGKICLVEEFTQANPMVESGTFHIRAPSATKYLLLPQANSEELVESGSPDGMSTWQLTLAPGYLKTDGPLALEVEARGESFNYRATFTVSVLTAVANKDVTIRRTKKRIIAVYQFDARTTLTAVLSLTLDAFAEEQPIIRQKHVTRTVGPGHQVITVAYSKALIKRKCLPYPHCSVLAHGHSWLGNLLVDQGTYDRKKVK